MSYLEVNLDPFVSLKEMVNSPLTNPLNLLSYIESVGVGGISFTYRYDIDYINDLSDLRAMTGSRINIRIPADMNEIQRILPLKPDVITLVDLSTQDSTVQVPSQELKEISETLSENEDFALSLRIKPDLKQLKAAYQYGVDIVEIATNDLVIQDTHKGFLNILELIVHIARTAEKHGLRVAAAGQLNRRIVLALNEVCNVEFISIGRAILSQSLIIGFEAGLREIMDIVDNR